MKKFFLLLSFLFFSLQATEKPNILFILTDDLGFGDVGFNGQSKIKTPHIDSMAKNGAIMTNFYAGAPVCGPSRATLLYGQHTGHAPIRGNPKWTASGKRPQMAKDATVFPKDLKRAGYSTAVFGKWAMNEVISNAETGDGSGHPFHQGFDEFVGFNTHVEAHFHWPDTIWDGYKKVNLSKTPNENWQKKLHYADDIFTEKTLDFIERKAGTPFFIYLNYTAPHKGYSAPEDSRKEYENQDWPLVKGKSGHYRDDANILTAYAAMITRFDHGIGQILKKLKDKGIANNTLIIFTNDNGHELSSGFFNSGKEFSGKKRSVTEGGIRVPTVVVWPQVVKAGSTIDSSLAFWDFMPTLCEIAGVAPAGPTDGISFLPALKGELEKQKEHQYLYWEFNEKQGPMQAIRFKSYKAIRYWDKKKKQMGPLQLYNLNEDKSEKKNLALKMPELASEALKMIKSARTEHPEWTLVPRKKKAASNK